MTMTTKFLDYEDGVTHREMYQGYGIEVWWGDADEDMGGCCWQVFEPFGDDYRCTVLDYQFKRKPFADALHDARLAVEAMARQ